jgi:hypothetical protein
MYGMSEEKKPEIILFADVFDFRESNAYALLAQVWECSAKLNNPNAKVILNKRPAPDTHGIPKRCMISNTVKINDWIKIMEQYPDDYIVFMDCDMLVLKDLSPVFEKDFDVAVTKHSIGSLPYNGGVVFVKNTQKAKAFMKLWADVNTKMFKDHTYHAKYIKKYAGMNQAAFGAVINEYTDRFYFDKEKHNDTQAHVLNIPCSIYNLCRGYWPAVNNDSYVVHIKSELRQACLWDRPSKETEACYKLWKKYEAMAGVEKKQIVNYPKDLKKFNRPKSMSTYEFEMKNNLYRYAGGYQAYLKAQIEATKQKAPIKKTWELEENIKYLCGVIKDLVPRAKNILVHGSRNGEEQKWFRKYLKGCIAFGSEICPELKDIPNTVIWDFNKVNPDWIGRMDVIFTNSLDHVYNPVETVPIWLKQLTSRGRLIIEYTIQHEVSKPTPIDPFHFTRKILPDYIMQWSNNEYQVYQFLSATKPKSIGRKLQLVEYAVIERIGLRK